MYGEDDHHYLKLLGENEMHIHRFDLPLYNHQKYQLEFFNRYDYPKNAHSLLDVGCGSGFYMSWAKRAGIEATGIEFNQNFAALLRKKTGLDIWSFEEFENRFNGKKFDLVHFGHILEHLENPGDFITTMRKWCHNETLIIVDGPLERNACFSRTIITLGSKIKKRKMNFYAPQHLSFTDATSQLRFFENNRLETVHFTVAEQMFPFPDRADYHSVRKLMLFLTGRMSVFFSRFNNNWGNIFHYAGKFR